MPETWEGEILVPFAIESSLSGVMREVGEKKELVYQRMFSVPAGGGGGRPKGWSQGETCKLVCSPSLFIFLKMRFVCVVQL